MRILVLTDAGERHYFFANRIIEETGQVVGVITGAKRMVKDTSVSGKVLRGYQKGTLWSSLRNALYHLLFGAYGRNLFADKAATEEKVFGGSKDRFFAEHQSLLLATVDSPHRSVNDPYYVDMIHAVKPDLIVVMGTCLLQKDIIAAAPLMLNIHTGLSPYYRGGYTNFWPIVEDEYGYFGVTVHKMSLGIDAGDIAFTARPALFPDDTYGSINCRAIQLGADLMIRAIREADKGTLAFVPQWTEGKLYHNRDMNDLAARTYNHHLSAFLKEYCRRAEAQTLDTVQLVENGVLTESV